MSVRGVDPNQRFEDLTTEYLAELYAAQPVMATAMGVHAYDDQLPNVSPYAHDEELRHARAYLHAIDKLSLAGMSPELRIDYRLARSGTQVAIAEMEKIRRHERQPSGYIDEAVYGLYLLMERSFADVETRAVAMLGRLQRLPTYFLQARENLTVCPALFTEVGIETGQAAESFFAQTLPAFADRVASQALRAELVAAAADSLEALQTYVGYLRDVVAPAAAGPFGIGEETFNYLLRVGHFLDLTADDLAEIGIETLDRTRVEVAEVAKQVSDSAPWWEVLAEAKRQHPSADGLTAAYRREMERAREFIELKRLLDLPPPGSLVVTETPPFARHVLPYAAYLPPAPFDADQTGQFWVTPIDPALSEDERETLLQGHSDFAILVVAVHEAYPGHHLQLSRANAVPSRIRRHFAHSTLFAEGWALYCEELMHELGFYADPRIRLMQLKDQMWRACRVIIDVELQAGKMTIDEAASFLSSQAEIEEPHALVEVKRYAMNPTQPMSYLMGKLLIREMRDALERRQGARFDLRRFHNDLLSYGTIPPRLIMDDMAGV